MKVFVLDRNSKPLMPTLPRKARLLLKSKRAKVVNRFPFTIQLLYGSSGYKQDISLGIDSGYSHIGFSAITEKEELVSGEVELLRGVPERIKEKQQYRRTRRNRLRYRPPRFNNRKIPKNWLAPSIKHKLDSHKRFINKLKSILPIVKITIEVANFDIQKIKNPDISGEEYKEGEQKGFTNTREYVLHRDGHKCKNPDCVGNPTSKTSVLVVHHIDFNRANNHHSNLITLCSKCHSPKNHNGFLKNWKPKISNTFKAETFMSTIRWKLVDDLNCNYTYGYVTKQNRYLLKLPKTHANDAFVIAGGSLQGRSPIYQIKQVRRNNRSLEKFYDATYIDSRDGSKRKGRVLSSGRTKRNKNLITENLRKYRKEKVKKGRRSIRRVRYPIQPFTLCRYGGSLYYATTTRSLGRVIDLKGLDKSVNSKKVEIVKHGKGFCWYDLTSQEYECLVCSVVSSPNLFCKRHLRKMKLVKLLTTKTH